MRDKIEEFWLSKLKIIFDIDHYGSVCLLVPPTLSSTVEHAPPVSTLISKKVCFALMRSTRTVSNSRRGRGRWRPDAREEASIRPLWWRP